MDKSRIPATFWRVVAFSISKHLQPLQTVILAPESNSDTTIPTIPVFFPTTEHRSTEMFSRTVRAVSCRALAGSLRPIAAPVSRQAAPQIAQPQRRHYHEKVLDRASHPKHLRLFPRVFQAWSIANIVCDRLLSPAQRRHIRQVGQLGGRGIGGSAGRMLFPASTRHPFEQALKYMLWVVRRCYAAPYQG